jgi:hypothetical protein
MAIVAMGEVGSGLARAGRISAGVARILSAEREMTDGQREPRTDRVWFTGTADIERLLADAPGIRAALLEEGVPASTLSVTADAVSGATWSSCRSQV